jgi:hypothetical protein
MKVSMYTVDKKCANCPLAAIFEMAISIQKAKIKSSLKDFKKVKGKHPLLDLSNQLN